MEDALEPDLAICDPHHHLWVRDGNRYMLEELKADTGSGHRVMHTVFVECMSGYRSDGPEAFRPVGETEFIVATDPDGFIAGIVGFADLRAPEIADVPRRPCRGRRWPVSRHPSRFGSGSQP